ncbi:Ceramide synthase 1 [Aphanomyces cochlioides]|nr:Ceramide synthase 1 [Aphanomyces cochlioides]
MSGKGKTPSIKKVPKPNPFLDWLLASLVAAECVVICRILPQDLLVMLGGLIVLVAIAVWITKASFRAGGGYISRNFLKHLGDPLRKEVTMKKFCDQSWQLVIHASMTVLEIIVLREENWWNDTTSLWNPNSPTCDFPEQKFLTKLLYITQLAIWIYTAFSCKFLEEVRKDYLVMMSHHVVTIALVTWSYAMGFLPVGVVVLIIHDASDIPLDLLKMANYMKVEDRKGFFITEILFVLTLSIWIYLRVYLYPVKLLNTTLFEARRACCTSEVAYDFSVFAPNPGPPLWLPFNLLLGSLYALHLWWTYLLLKILKGVFSSNVHEHAEDEYEGASDSGKED